MAAEDDIPLSWIVLFVLLSLGIGVGAILCVGGDLLAVGVGTF